MAPKVHAPDGGLIPRALCEDLDGDVNYRERDVDCGDCLDLLENADQDLLLKLIRHGWQSDRPAVQVTRDEAPQMLRPRSSGRTRGMLGGIITRGRKTGIIGQLPE